MTFPDDFQVFGSRADVQRQLGNAVPLELGKAVVRALSLQLGYLEPQNESEERMSLTGERVLVA
jgi:DNA (cytosine-5)-methyltransferase 1